MTPLPLSYQIQKNKEHGEAQQKVASFFHQIRTSDHHAVWRQMYSHMWLVCALELAPDVGGMVQGFFLLPHIKLQGTGLESPEAPWEFMTTTEPLTKSGGHRCEWAGLSESQNAWQLGGLLWQADTAGWWKTLSAMRFYLLLEQPLVLTPSVVGNSRFSTLLHVWIHSVIWPFQ